MEFSFVRHGDIAAVRRHTGKFSARRRKEQRLTSSSLASSETRRIAEEGFGVGCLVEGHSLDEAQPEKDSKDRTERWSRGLVQRQTPTRNLSVSFQSQLSSGDLRSLRWYRERTSIEWSGGDDCRFWTDFTMSVAEQYPALAHSLIALATGHEGLHTDKRDLQTLSVAQASKSTAWFVQNSLVVSRPAWITYCIIMAQFSALVNPRTYFRCLKMLAGVLNDPDPDPYQLRPLIQRIFSHQCQMLDPRPLLRRIAFCTPPASLEINDFRTISEARGCLEQILHLVVSQIKHGTLPERILLETWLIRFETLKNQGNHLPWLILKAAYGMSLIQIDALSNDTEMLYDHYLSIYVDVANAYEAMLQSTTETVQYRFNIDSGLMGLASWAGKWCRDPIIKARLIQLLRSARRSEGICSSTIWARVLEVLQMIEEAGINPTPSSCSDVPQDKRIRLQSAALDWKARLIRLDILHYPYNMSTRDVWVSYTYTADSVFLQPDQVPSLASQFHPETIMGPGYLTFLESEESISYFTIHATEFAFALPGT